MAVPITMRAVLYDEFQKRPTLADVPVPEVLSDSVLVRVRATGICRSDWHGWMGHDPDIQVPHVPGHEFAGEIVKLGGDVRNWKLDQRVTTPFVQACGSCVYCEEGDFQVCMDQEQAGFTSWGSFAEYVLVRYADINLVELPADMSFETAAILGCRFGTAFRALIDQAEVRKGQKILVVGCGGLGLSMILIAKACGVSVCGIDPSPAARKLALQLGADIAYDHLQLGQIKRWAGHGVHACFDAVGDSSLLDIGLQTLRRRGRYIQVGLLPDVNGIPSASFERLVAQELEIIGSHGIQSDRYGDMLKFISEHEIPIHRLIVTRCNLSESIDYLLGVRSGRSSGISLVLP